jgi:hypothetical protein
VKPKSPMPTGSACGISRGRIPQQRWRGIGAFGSPTAVGPDPSNFEWGCFHIHHFGRRVLYFFSWARGVARWHSRDCRSRSCPWACRCRNCPLPVPVPLLLLVLFLGLCAGLGKVRPTRTRLSPSHEIMSACLGEEGVVAAAARGGVLCFVWSSLPGFHQIGTSLSSLLRLLQLPCLLQLLLQKLLIEAIPHLRCSSSCHNLPAHTPHSFGLP